MISRAELIKAFPAQPRLRAELEQLDSTLSAAQAAIDALTAQIAAAQQSLDGDQRWQAASVILGGIDALSGLAGVVELLGNDQIGAREVDSTDSASLVSWGALKAYLAARGIS